ncbi:hypothetical protein [Deinococcus humi]|uniref:Uncharacterized protein n=1 Tax=Deinococcus humi TaxID=662880 RepID=A0A7W8NBU7_9DEIO|nr:hypothetical protein [Deinococcus humi]MBB5361499.1 hypothetical protein [Deinococcus humi]GGO20382.1 hypothetical protein GCM10008949_05590 [Deinococcus humi]
MAHRVTPLLTVARTGSRVVRSLIRPAQHGPGQSGLRGVRELGHDPWLTLDGPEGLRRQASRLARRGAGLGKLALQSVLGAVVIFPLLLIFGVLLALGFDPAGWLLGLTLLMGLLGLIRTAVRATRLMRAPDEDTLPQAAKAALPATLEADETSLLGTLRTHERALPPASRVAFHAAVIATRDALRVSADDAVLNRDSFDVRQAAREDIPELLETYRTVPPTPANQAELQRQLGLIEGRMVAVIRDREAQKSRALKAHGRYLEKKYLDSPEAEQD